MIESRWGRLRQAEDRLLCSVIAIGATMAASQLASGLISGAGASEAGAGAKSFLSDLLNGVKEGLDPYIKAGSFGVNAMKNLMTGPGGENDLLNSFLLKPFAPTTAEVANQPGYQFRLQQGKEAVQSGFGPKGLSTSGAAIKGAGTFATGLAQEGWQQDFDNYWANRKNIGGFLSGLTSAGLQANDILGRTESGVGVPAAQAGAAGTAGLYNGIANGVGGAGSSYANYSMIDKLINGSGGNGTGVVGSRGMYDPSQSTGWGSQLLQLGATG